MDSQVATKAVIVNPENKVLIMREGERWHEPGGRLEPGERLEEGLRREVREETGLVELTVGPVVHVGEWFAKPEGKRVHIVAVFYRCSTGQVEIELSNEHDEYAWVTRADLGRYELQPESRQAIEQVLAA
jgi:ADP-ribose pyrophosphatase YjhB (NUDIX family)